MKIRKSTIIALVLVVTSFVTIAFAIDGASTYAGVEEVKAHPDKTFHLVGTWVREKGFNYEPLKNTDSFAFYLEDSLGVQVLVVLQHPKPADFERSEKVVVTGNMEGNYFHAQEVLTKCPSKYNDDEIIIKSASALYEG